MQRNKYAPDKVNLGSMDQSTYLGEDSVIDMPLTSRDRTDIGSTFGKRGRSIELGQISRNTNNLTTAPLTTKRGTYIDHT